MTIKNVIKYSVLFFLSISLLGCKSPEEKDILEIKTTFTVSTLTDDDFSSVGGIDGTKEDFRKVYFSIHVEDNKHISDRKISIPDIKNVMNSYDIERYWYGLYSSLDYPGEDAEYTYDIMFLSKNLSDEEIKSMFSESQIIVTWINKDKKEETTKINLSDIIVFK